MNLIFIIHIWLLSNKFVPLNEKKKADTETVLFNCLLITSIRVLHNKENTFLIAA